MKITMSSSCALAKNFSRPRLGSVRSLPLTLGRISTPRMPRFFTQCSSSATARSAFCSGTVPMRDEAIRPRCRRSRQAARSPCARARGRDPARSSRCTDCGAGRHRLDVDAHAVHVLEPHLDGRELRPRDPASASRSFRASARSRTDRTARTGSRFSGATFSATPDSGNGNECRPAGCGLYGRAPFSSRRQHAALPPFSSRPDARTAQDDGHGRNQCNRACR